MTRARVVARKRANCPAQAHQQSWIKQTSPPAEALVASFSLSRPSACLPVALTSSSSNGPSRPAGPLWACVLHQWAQCLCQTHLQRPCGRRQPEHAAAGPIGVNRKHGGNAASRSTQPVQQQAVEQQDLPETHLRGPQRPGRCPQPDSGGLHQGWTLAGAQIWRHLHGITGKA